MGNFIGLGTAQSSPFDFNYYGPGDTRLVQQTIAQRNAIKYRFDGAECYVEETKTKYTFVLGHASSSLLDNANWVSISGYVLPIATATILGGIKVGPGLTIDPITGILTSTGGITDVTSPNTDIGVSTVGTTRVLTLNSGLGANKIVKRDGTGRIPLSTNTYISGDDSGTITHTGTVHNFYSGGNLKVQLSTSGLYVLSGNVQLSTSSQLTVQSLATVLPAPSYSVGLKMVVVDQSGNFTWRDIPSGGGGASITLTTTGTSGVATWDGTTLNIPNYTSGGSYTLPIASSVILGGVKVGTGLTIDPVTGVLNATGGGGGGGGGVWGYISGSLNDQIDLKNALDAKLSLTGGTLTGNLSGTNITLSGYITAAGGGGTSDIRLKTLIDSKLNLAFLDKDRTIAFKWKDKKLRGRDIHYGYSAQEIQEWAPELVFIAEDGTLSLNHVELLTLEIKRLKQRVKILEDKI